VSFARRAISRAAAGIIIGVIVTAIVVGVGTYYATISRIHVPAPRTVTVTVTKPYTTTVTKTVAITTTATKAITKTMVSTSVKTTTTSVTSTVTPTTTSTVTTGLPKKITFYTWWAGLERFAIDALIHAFEQKYHITVIKTAVPGGAGVNAKFAILALIMAGKPPAAFQVHASAEQISYFMAAPQHTKSFVDLTNVAKEIGLYNTPAAIASMLSGHLYGLPVDLHRANLLFINIHVLKKYGLPIPRTLKQLVYDAMVLKKHGVPAFLQAGADQFTVAMLWTQLFLAVGGPKKYIEFMYGTLNPNDPAIKKATELFVNLSKTFPSNWMSLDWTSAVAALIKGEGAFVVDGDWVVGLIHDVYPKVVLSPIDNITKNTDIVVEPFPGTQGIYSLVIDCIMVPKGPEAKAGVLFAKFFASKQGQEIFNPLKGAITDYPNTPLNIYPTEAQKWEVKQYSTAKYYVYALIHGGLFDDVWQKFLQSSILLAQTGNTNLWYKMIDWAIHQEYKEWSASGMFMGSLQHPFAGYIPPWVKK